MKLPAIHPFPIFLSVLFALAASGPLAAAGVKVAINEIHYHPGDDSREGEFIELANHGAEPADVGGWMLAGGVQFVFSEGTVIPPGGFLVVAADADLLASRYGADPARIAGSYFGNLSNAGERVDLLTAGGYLVSYAAYSDADPWPEAADGLGPSLERISPLTEDADPQGWTASILPGGTPGAANSARIEDPPAPTTSDLIPSGAVWRYLRGLQEPPAAWIDPAFVDSAWSEGPAGFGYFHPEIATVLNDMQTGYTTLYTRREFTIGDPLLVEGLTLTVIIDDGYVAYLNGVEVARFNAPGQPGSRVAFNAAATASVPDPATRTEDLTAFRGLLLPGRNVLAVQGLNRALGNRDFILHSRLTVRLAPPPPPSPGLTPPPRDLVINEVFPGGPGTGWVELYNPAAALLDLSGRRLHLWPPARGERVLPPGTAAPPRGFVVIGEAELGFELDGVPALILARSDRRFIDALNPRAVPGSPSTGRFPDGADNRYVFAVPTPGAGNAVDLSSPIVINEIMYRPAASNAGGEYIELHNRSAAAVDVSGWSLTRGVEYIIPPATGIPAGGYLVIAGNPAAAAARYGLQRVLGPWTGSLRNDAETVLLRDVFENPRDRVRYADEGSWPETADGTGPSLELIHPALENRYGPAWAASSGEGTPGARNSRFQDDPAPVIAGVEHSPVIPRANERVRVLAAIGDERSITAATLFHQVDGAGGNPAQVAMADDGVIDDGVAGNGIYGGEIPPRADRAIVRFWIRAAAAGGQSVTVPAGAPQPAFLYQVEDAAPPAGARPIYRVVMQAADLNSLRTRGVNSDVLLDATFVANGRAYYNRGIRYRGSSARSCSPLSYRIQFDHDRDFHGLKRLNLNGCNAQRQWIGLDFLARTGLATPECWFRRLSLNGTIGTDLHLRVEVIDDQFLERNFPDDDDGNLYRGAGQANLDYLGQNFSSYRSNYIKETNEEEDDYGDVVDLCFRFDGATTPDRDFPAAIEERIDAGQWALYFAAFAILGSTENSILLDNGDDYFLYHRFSDGRWILLPWDLDSCFNDAQQVLFRPTVDSIERFLEHARYAPDYWCHLENLLANAFTAELVDARIDRIEPLFPAARIQPLRAFHGARRTYIASRTRSEFEVSVQTGGRICEGTLYASQQAVSIGGRAPGCGATEVLVDGRPVSYNPQTNAWSANYEARDAGPLVISARYRDGTEVARAEFLVAPPAPAPSALPAEVTGSLTLRRAQSPYRAAATVNVRAGARLTVEPGVAVLLDQDAALLVAGALVAEGTEAEPIRFERADCGETWRGIAFQAGSTGSRLARCRIRNVAATGGQPAAIVADGAEVFLESIDFEPGGAPVLARNGAALHARDLALEGGAEGIAFERAGGSVRSLWARGLSGAAVRASGPAAAALAIEDSIIAGCGTGIVLEDGAQAALSHLTIIGCGMGLVLRERTPGAGGASATGDSLIIWETADAASVGDNSLLDMSYSNTAAGALAGVGNISADPMFADAAALDLRLRYRSPCRASGKGGTDMGAIPYAPVGEVNRFRICDSNADGSLDIADPVFTLVHLFEGRLAVPCAAAIDCNSDGLHDISDVIFHLSYLFLQGSAPRAPYPDCALAPIEECIAETCAP